MNALLRLALGACFGAGLLLVVSGWRTPPTRRQRTPKVDLAQLPRFGGSALVGLIVYAATGWPVAGVAAAFAVIALMRPTVSGASSRDRIEALAGWAEQLRDTLSAGHGIAETIQTTATIAPEAIRPQVARLAARLRREQPRAALQGFADELADPTADLIVTILALAIERSGRAASELLSELAVTARQRAEMRLRVDAERSSTRAEARWVAISSAAMMIGLMVFGHRWLKPYGTNGGQIVLAIVLALFAAGLIGLQRLARYREVARFLKADLA